MFVVPEGGEATEVPDTVAVIEVEGSPGVPAGRDVQPGAPVIGRHYVTERDSAPIQYNGIVLLSRYWYTKVCWLTLFDQSEPVAHPYREGVWEV